MQISCPSCSAQYNVDESRIPPQGVSIKCPRCQHQFVVQSPNLAAPVPAAPSSSGSGAVALPGSKGAAVPLPGSAGAVPLPGGGRGAGAVPLPGAGGVPLPGAVPLPGGGGPVPLPGGGGFGAVPLPGAGGVPLPGASVPLPGASSVPLPGASVPLPGGSVPLPGAGSVPLPGGSVPGGSVPLPGASLVPLPGGSVPLPSGSVPLPGTAPRPAPALNDIFGDVSAAPAVGPAPTSKKAASMADIFGDLDNGGDAPSTPFHGTNSVVVNTSQQGTGLLDFIDDAGSAEMGLAPKQEQFRIRKRSGRVMGPYDAQTILQMFARGELLGSEEGSADGVTWKPLAQIPAFSETIQKAMSSALGGLDDLPVPRGTDLPVPRGTDLPTPKHKNNNDVSVQSDLQVGTGDLLQAEKAKEEVERRRREKSGGKRGAVLAIAASAFVLLVCVGVALQFVTPYGYFGYKLLFPDAVVVVDDKKPVLEAPPPPPTLPEDNREVAELLRDDSYASYRTAAEKYARIVDTKKAQTPFPLEGKQAAAEQARVLGYLTIVEDMAAFGPQLKAALALAPGGDDVSVAIATAADAYAEGKFDAGVDGLKPFADPVRSLPAGRLAEVLVWQGIGLRAKGDLEAAMKKVDEALQADLKSPFALSQQATLLAQSAAPEPASEYLDKVFAVAPTHPRATILKGKLMSATSATLEEGKALLTEMSEGAKGKLASPAQQAEAFMGRAEIAISARSYPEAMRFLSSAVQLVPQNRALRVRAAEMSIRLREYAVAREHAKALLAVDVDDPDGVAAMARAKMGTRDTLGAYTDLQVALKKHPEDAALTFWFGVAAKEMGKLPEARASFEKAQKLNPKSADPVVENVIDAIERGKLAEALKIADGAMNTVTTGERYRVRSVKAYAFARRRQFPEAKAEYERALAENPRDSDTRARFAELLVQTKQLSDAEKQVDEALQMDGKNPAVLLAAGEVARGRGELKQALDRFEEAMQLAPNTFEPYTRAAVAAAKLKDVQRAKGLVETAGQLRPNNPDVIATQAMVLSVNDPKQAASLLQSAGEAAPEDPLLPYLLGITNQSMGQNVEAVDALKRAVALAPDYDDAWFALGKVNRELGRNDEAKKCFGEVVRIDPMRADGHVEIADLFATLGDDAGALESYERALKAEPNNPSSVCAMGETLVVRLGEDNKNLKRGIDMLERCVKLSAKHPSAWKNLGNAYKTVVPIKKREAVTAYKTHLSVNPEDPENAILKDFIVDLGGKVD